jgi:ferredoxin-NADP reductase
MQLTLDEITKHNKDIITFWFISERPMEYTAGQFIDLTLPHMEATVRNRHWFTLSSSPTEDRLAITTRISPHNSSTYKQTLARLKPGDRVLGSDPMGDFVLPIQRTTPILFVAGGMGITPVRSMIKWLTDEQQQRPVQLIYTVHQPEDIIFGDILSTYGIQPYYNAAEPDESWPHGVGRISAQDILMRYPVGGYIYISGPELMTERLVDELKQQGFPSNKVVTDYFPGYAAL